MDATLIVKYRTPTSKPLQCWQDLFPALQISLGEDARTPQEFSVQSPVNFEPTQFLLDVWKAIPMDDLEWADLLLGSQRLRILGGDLEPHFEFHPIP